MVKFIVLVVSFTSVTCLADPLTNVNSLVGVPLTTNEIIQLPSRDAASPDTVFLGTVRALRMGCLRDLFYHFETNYLFNVTGCYNQDDIPLETVLSFQAVMNDDNFSNVVITAYSTATSNQFVRVAASLQENHISRTFIEPLSLTLHQSSSGWKIVAYDDDKWNE